MRACTLRFRGLLRLFRLELRVDDVAEAVGRGQDVPVGDQASAALQPESCTVSLNVNIVLTFCKTSQTFQDIKVAQMHLFD